MRPNPETQRLLAELDEAEGWRRVLTYWLLRAYVANGREGFEDGPSAGETFSSILDVLANAGMEPDYDQGSKAFVGYRAESMPLALAWASERYGVTEWAPSPFGGAQVPKEIRDAAERAVKEQTQ